MQSGDFYTRVINTNYPQAAGSHGPQDCRAHVSRPILTNPSHPSFVSQTNLTCATQPLVATCIQHGTRPCALSDRIVKMMRQRGSKRRAEVEKPPPPRLLVILSFVVPGSKATSEVASPWARREQKRRR